MMYSPLAKKCLSVILLLSCFTSFAQKKEEGEKNNSLKINLPALLVRNFSVQYERIISHRASVALNVKYLPYGKLPWEKSVENIINNPYEAYVKISQFKLGAAGATAELRMYSKRKGAMHGFYWAPSISYVNYRSGLPISYNNKTGIFDGNIGTLTGGIQLGCQWSLTKSLYLDWWILGPSFGASFGKLDFAGTLSQTEQDILASEIEDFKGNLPFNFIQSYTLNGNGGNIKIDGPWAGFRGLGFALGVRF